jgi:glutamyl-Q tRNA(Asp) synthetase
MPSPVFRFAPSPNGLLHLGHAYSALLNRQLATATGGKLLLRIEDIDLERCTPEFEAQMLEDLDWIGFAYDGEILRQSERLEAYRAALAELDRLGLIYPSAMSRADIRRLALAAEASGTPLPADPDGATLYPGKERDYSTAQRRKLMAESADYALRLDTRRAVEGLRRLYWREVDDETLQSFRRIEADATIWGDVILARKSLATSYHLSCVVDDSAQAVTHVVRGKDLFAATAVHRLLQHLLGFTEPDYFHHRLIFDEDGRKLAKSRSSTALAHLRAAGVTRDEICRQIDLEPPR